MKKLISNVVNVLSIAIILLALFILASVVMTRSGDVPQVGGYSVLRVLTGSMEPDIPTDSVILVRIADGDQVQVGDVISFYSADPAIRGSVNTHRVIGIEAENGTRIFRTQGDANLVPDQYPVDDANLIGIVVGSSYAVGRIIRLLSNPLVFFPLVLIPLLVMVILNVVSAIRSAGEIMRQEESEAIREALEEAKRKRQEKLESDARKPDEEQ